MSARHRRGLRYGAIAGEVTEGAPGRGLRSALGLAATRSHGSRKAAWVRLAKVPGAEGPGTDRTVPSGSSKLHHLEVKAGAALEDFCSKTLEKTLLFHWEDIKGFRPWGSFPLSNAENPEQCRVGRKAGKCLFGGSVESGPVPHGERKMGRIPALPSRTGGLVPTLLHMPFHHAGPHSPPGECSLETGALTVPPHHQWIHTKEESKK